MTCPLEKRMIELLNRHGIKYSQPERNIHYPTTLDFYLPTFALYVEVKQFHTDRLCKQLAAVPERTSVLVLVGPNAVADFERFAAAISSPL